MSSPASNASYLLQTAAPRTPFATANIPRPVVTDLTVCTFSPTDSTFACKLDPRIWHRIEKDLYLYTSQQSAWLYIALANKEDLAAEDLLITDIRVGEPPPSSFSGRS